MLEARRRLEDSLRRTSFEEDGVDDLSDVDVDSDGDNDMLMPVSDSATRKKKGIVKGKSGKKSHCLFAETDCERERLLGLRGVRVGEASHPGPPFVVRSANVTSLMPHLPYIASFECDAIALQEVRLTIDGQKIVSNELVKLGWVPFWGEPQPIRSGTVKSVLDAKQGGVGMLIRAQHQGGPSPRSAVGQELQET